MKHLKIFEKFFNNTYMRGGDNFFISDVMKYLKVDTIPLDEDYKPESPYDIDVIDFFKEIFLNKDIIFRPLQKYNENKSLTLQVKDVKYFAYKDDVYIKVKIYDVETKHWLWYLLRNNELIFVKKYDADTKPLHKEVVMKKTAEKYNI